MLVGVPLLVVCCLVCVVVCCTLCAGCPYCFLCVDCCELLVVSCRLLFDVVRYALFTVRGWLLVVSFGVRSVLFVV